MNNKKWCTKCDLLKPLEEFGLAKENKTDGRRADFKKCRKEYKNAYRSSEVYKETQMKYYKSDAYKLSQKSYRESEKGRATNAIKAANRRAAKLEASKYNTADENYLINCIYAFCAFKTKHTGIPHHVDHKYPLSKGGKHHPDNLQILTAEQNFKKGAKLP